MEIRGNLKKFKIPGAGHRLCVKVPEKYPSSRPIPIDKVNIKEEIQKSSLDK